MPTVLEAAGASYLKTYNGRNIHPEATARADLAGTAA